MNFIIKNYINKLKNEDIIKFALENNITINEEEANYIYNITKNNIDELLNGNENETLKNINEKLGKEKGKTIAKLFYEYKEKYRNYL